MVWYGMVWYGMFCFGELPKSVEFSKHSVVTDAVVTVRWSYESCSLCRSSSHAASSCMPPSGATRVVGGYRPLLSSRTSGALLSCAPCYVSARLVDALCQAGCLLEMPQRCSKSTCAKLQIPPLSERPTQSPDPDA